MTRSKLWGIIQRMKHIFSIYQITKIVDDLVNEHEKDEPTPKFQLSGNKAHHPTSMFVRQQFRHKHGANTSRAVSVLESTISNGYLLGSTGTIGDTKVDMVCVTDKGRELLDTVPYLPFLKIGLYEALWAKHGGFISGVILGTLIPILIALVKWILIMATEGS